jgi:hypothetical protein
MRKLRKVHFFCSIQKREQETQATIAEPPVRVGSLIDRFRSGDLEAILLREVRFFTPIAAALIDGYNARLSFYAAAVSHPSFDILTPPRELFKYLPALTFDFFDDSVTISVPDEKPQHFPLTPLAPLLEILESGVLNSDFAFSLKKMKCKFENGFIICKCVDHRFSPVREVNMKLEVGPDVIAAAVAQSKQPLEAERQVIMLQRPAVCTDPSPDVARLQSIIDFRKKMWQRREDRVREDDVVPKPPLPVTEKKLQTVRMGESRSRLHIPEEIQKLCMKDRERGTEWAELGADARKHNV